MLFLNKLLPLIVLPFGLVCGLVLFAFWRKKPGVGLLAFGLFYLCSIPLVSTRLIGWLESRYPEIPLERVERADAVVVLGGILGPRSVASTQPNWTETVERFEAGVALMQAGRAGHLIFMGARMPWEDRETTEGAELQRLAVARGVAPEKIVVTREIANTATEAKAVAELMQLHGWRRIILVTTGWHMPRSALLFRQAGVDFIPFPVDFRRDRTRTLAAIDFIPKAEAWQMTETAIRECYGWMYYAFPRP